VIPWGSGDDGSQQAADKLRVALDAAFKNKLAEVASTSVFAAWGVPNCEDLQKVPRQLTWASSKKYLSKTDAFPRPVRSSSGHASLV
jgi:hypothetical protein